MSLAAFVLLVVAPILEIASIVAVAQVAGWWTLVLMAAQAILGAYVLRRTGRDWMQRVRAQDEPARAAGDSALRFAAGLLLMSPGFASTVVGLLLLVPFVRVLLRGAVAAWFVRRFVRVSGPGGTTIWQRVDPDHPDVIRGEVVRDDEAGPGTRGPGSPGELT